MRARCSANWVPIVITGLSALRGSCGMKAISRPSRWRRVCVPMRTRSLPAKASEPFATEKPGGSNCATARPIIDLPAPDSPTRPSTFPASSAKEMSESTGRRRPSRSRDSTVRFSAERRAHRHASRACARRGSSVRRRPSPRRLKPSTVMKIASIGKHEIPGGFVDRLACIGDHLAPGRLVRSDAHADEGEDRLDDHRDSHLDAQERDQERHGRREDFPRQRSPMGEADEPRRRHIVLTGRDQDLGAQHAAKARPVDEHDGENDADHPGAEPGHQHERQDDGRKGHPHIDGASDQPIHPAAEIAGEMGEGRTDEHRAERGSDRDRHGDARAEQTGARGCPVRANPCRGDRSGRRPPTRPAERGSRSGSAPRDHAGARKGAKIAQRITASDETAPAITRAERRTASPCS